MNSTKKAENHSENSFDFLRVVAALSVLYSHSFALIGLHEPQPIAGQTYGSLAVALFFAISGFLVCQSWSRDPSPKRFAIRRALRILPALFVVVVFTALIVGPIFSSLPAKEYLFIGDTWKYIFNAGLMLEVSPLPGLFENNLYPKVNNGSLWTLRYEVLMYAFLTILGSYIPRARLKVACLTSFVVCGGMWGVLTIANLTPYKLPFVWRLGTELFADRLFYLGAFFFAGSCLYLYFDRFRLSMIAATLLIALCVFIPNKNHVMPLLWIAIPYAAIAFAYRAPSVFRKLNGQDYSYGIYIYAFPIQQIVSLRMASGTNVNWLASLLISAFITVLFATLSWNFVERPALSLKSRLSTSRFNHKTSKISNN